MWEAHFGGNHGVTFFMCSSWEKMKQCLTPQMWCEKSPLKAPFFIQVSTFYYPVKAAVADRPTDIERHIAAVFHEASYVILMAVYQ